MQHIHTAPVEIFSAVGNGPYVSEPYEAGWALEATAMLYIHSTLGASPCFELRAQISADGQRWIDFGCAFEPMTEPGGYFLNLKQYGNWLRLEGEISGGPEDGAPAFVFDLYWVLKG
jgi:hypothetical protein